MVYVHGGGWVIGDKREQGKPMMYELVARGWVCVAINYRLSPKANWPDHIVDVKRALAWVKEHIARVRRRPRVHRAQRGFRRWAPLRAGGAHRRRSGVPAGLRGRRHVRPGLRPLLRRDGPDVGPRGLGRSSARDCVEMLEKTVMKVKESDHPEVFRNASPTYRVQAEAPPFFVLQGTNDTLVPVETARPLRRAPACGLPLARGLRRIAPGPARVRRPGLAPLPGHDVRGRRFPRRRPGGAGGGGPDRNGRDRHSKSF